MIAEIISVGTELLLGQTVDTNAAYLSSALATLGVDLYRRTTVGDNRTRLSDAVALAVSRADIVFTIGGLGPTQDDITKEVVAEVMGVALVTDAAQLARLNAFASTRPNIPSTFYKQAEVPSSGEGMLNSVGTALGAIFETDSAIAICLPGPPREFTTMVDGPLQAYVALKTGNAPSVLVSRTLRVAGMGESLVEDRIDDLLASQNPTVAPYAKTSEVHLRVTARAGGEREANELIEPTVRQIAERLGDAIYGVDDQTLSAVVVQLLKARKKTVATAESCTGGLVAKLITDNPGSSDVFHSGYVCYSDAAKSNILGVDPAVIARDGVVSESVARAMAEGARRLSGSDYALATTGISGPGGGTPTAPVGTVCVALATDRGTNAWTYNFFGTRADVSERAAHRALNTLRCQLLNGNCS